MNKKYLRKFGLGGFVITGLLGTLFFLKGKTIPNYIFWGLSSYSLLFALVFPKGLLPFYKIMTLFGLVLGWINTRIILSVMFYLVFTPIAVFFRIIGRDGLRLKKDKNAKSYWTDRGEIPKKESYEHQF